jgi:hypothetical protein
MGPLLDDVAHLHDDDLRGLAHGGQTVRDHDGGARLHEVVQRRLHDALARRVERRRRLVQQQHARVAQQRARDGDALLLAARQLDALVAHLRVVALRQRLDEGVDVGGARRLEDFLVRRRALGPGAVLDVVQDAHREERRLLRHDADVAAQRPQVERADVLAVEHDGAR